MSEPLEPTRDDADAKAWFYLDHRHDIETWAALRTEGRQLLDKQLIGIAAEVEEMANTLNAEVSTSDLESGPLPTFQLRRRDWRHNGTADVSVVVQWERARLLTPGSNEWPYVAVRLPADAADEPRRRQVNEALKPVRAKLKGSSSRTFPFWLYVQPPTGAPLNPKVIARDLVSRFHRLWQAAAPAIDTLHTPPPTLA